MEYILIIFGIFILCWAYFKTIPYRNSKSWKETEGTILISEERTFQRPEIYVSIEYSYPIISYQYTAGNKVYKGNKVTFEKENIMENTDNKLWLSWSVNQKIPIYFNPEKNSESVIIRNLLPKRKSHYHSLFISGLLCIIVGAISLGLKA